MSSQISRRSVVAGIAWAAPAVTAATVAPAIAASPDRCTPNATLSWGGASTTKLANGTVYTIQGTDTVYARVTYVETAEVFAGTNTRGQRYSTAQYQLTVGKVAYGRVADALAPHVNWYDLTTTGGSNDLILNQRGGSGSTTVTVDFFRDPGLRQPVYVHDLQVPLDDLSVQRTYSGFATPRYRADLSYQEKWSVVGTTANGSVTPSRTGWSGAYPGSTAGMVAGSGTSGDPWHIPTSYTSSSHNQAGGNVMTQFLGQSVNSVTITYGSTGGMTGPQGAGIGRLTMCV